MDWSQLSDFINSTEAPSLGILGAITGRDINVAVSGPGGTTAVSTGAGAFAATPAGTVAAGQGTVLADTISGRPGLLLIGVAVIVGLFAIFK